MSWLDKDRRIEGKLDDVLTKIEGALKLLTKIEGTLDRKNPVVRTVSSDTGQKISDALENESEAHTTKNACQQKVIDGPHGRLIVTDEFVYANFHQFDKRTGAACGVSGEIQIWFQETH